jgi:hypothetical protein
MTSAGDDRPGRFEASCVPAWLKFGYAAMLLVLAPIFALEYGLTNFLWFSNVALVGTLVAIWLRSRLLLGMMAVAVVLLEIGWNVAFWGRLLFGMEDFGAVGYMFDERIPLWARLFSLYHVPLPVVLLWLVWRCGYDPRALRWQTALAWVVLPLSLVVSEPWENINLVHGPIDATGEPLLDQPVPLLLLMLALPLLVYWPTHAVLKRISARR